MYLGRVTNLPTGEGAREIGYKSLKFPKPHLLGKQVMSYTPQIATANKNGSNLQMH